MSKITEYFKETKAEFKHVNWPTRQQTLMYTITVVFVSICTAAFLGAFDTLFAYLLRLIVS